jgi:spermidine synthase
LRAAVYILFLLSGACGLVYEVVWSRVMTEVFGSTVLAVGTVLAAFMSGLALGSYLLGKQGDRSPNPLRLYAALEVGVGLTALIAMALMDRVDTLYLALYDTLGGEGAPLSTARFLCAFALVAIPTLLMGATLPVLSRFVITRLSAVGSGISTLYAINTMGAVSGSVVTGFYLIRAVGIHRSVYLAVACNVGIGILAWLLARRFAAQAPTAPSPRAERTSDETDETGTTDHTTGDRMLLWVFGLSGFASFAYEIYWTRSLVHLMGNSTYAFTMMLAAFLSGIAIGGFLIRFVVDRYALGLKTFAWLQILIGATSAAALPLLFWIVRSPGLRDAFVELSNQVGMLILSHFVISLLVMLVPATLIGATFPLVGRIYVRNLHQTGADVGKVYAANTLGNVLGALAPAFVLLPLFGIQKGVVLMAALNVSIGLFILLSLRKRLAGLRWVAPLVFVGAAAVLTQVTFGFQFPAGLQKADDRVLYYREGLAGTTKVFQEINTGEKRMSVDGIVIGGTEFTDYKQQILAHLPKLLLKDYDSELSIGLGSGILAGESLRHEGLERIICVEIEPSVIEGAAWFAEENYGVLEDPRAEIVLDDVGNFLRTTSERYDIISADEKTADKYASNGFSYSLDYYYLLREHLNPSGLVIQWIPNQLPPNQYQMVLQTFATAFPEMSLWYFPGVGKGAGNNTFVVGSLQKIEIDPDWMNRTLKAEPTAFEGWQQYGLMTAESLLAHYVADAEATRTATEGAPLNTLQNPYYEFYSPSDYAIEVAPRLLASHDFLVDLRLDRGLADLSTYLTGPISSRLTAAFQAEDHFLTGLRLQMQGRSYTAFSNDFDMALSIAPWNYNLRGQIASYLWNHAGVLYVNGRQREALSYIRRAVDVFPTDGEIRYYHGRILLQTGQREQARAEIRTAIEMEPRLLSPRRLLASELLATREYAEAIAQMDAILAIEPDDIHTLVSLGIFLAEQGSDSARAENLMQRAYRLAPRGASVIDGRAWMAFVKGDRATARRIVERGGNYYENEPLFARRRQRILQTAP